MASSRASGLARLCQVQRPYRLVDELEFGISSGPSKRSQPGQSACSQRLAAETTAEQPRTGGAARNSVGYKNTGFILGVHLESVCAFHLTRHTGLSLVGRRGRFRSGVRLHSFRCCAIQVCRSEPVLRNLAWLTGLSPLSSATMSSAKPMRASSGSCFDCP